VVDPLAEVISLLKPRAVYSKVISGAGAWAVRYSEFGQPSFCAMLEGECTLAVDGEEPITLLAGDFLLMPATPGFTMSGAAPAAPVFVDARSAPVPEGEIRHGNPEGPPDMRMLGGYFGFDSPDAALMVSLLPALLHVRGIGRLPLLVQLVREESIEEDRKCAGVRQASSTSRGHRAREQQIIIDLPDFFCAAFSTVSR